MRSTSSFVGVNVIYLAVASAMVLHAYFLPGEGGLVPLVIGIPTMLMGLGSTIRGVRMGRKSLPQSEESGDEDNVAPWGRASRVVAWLGALVIGVFFVGFYVSIPLFVLAYVWFTARVAWPRSIALTLILWGVVYGSFAMILQRPLFEGVLFGAILPLL